MPDNCSFLSNLDEILRALELLQRPVVALLRPGKSHADIAARFSEVGLTLREELALLYGWRNGTAIAEGTILDDIHFFPGFYFLSLEHAVDQYRVLQRDASWNPSWFPIFANDGGDFYAINLSAASREGGEIVGFMIGEFDQPIEYESLQAMVATLAECYEQNVFYLTAEGWLEMDSRRHADIARKHNPSISLWLSR